MPLTAVINTAIPQTNSEIIRDRLVEILTIEFALQGASFPIAGFTYPKICRERFINIDDSDFPVIVVRLYQVSYLDSDGNQTQDSSGNRIGTNKFFIDIYTGAPSTDTEFGDEIATVALQRLQGMVCSILEDTRYGTLGFDPLTSGIGNTHIEGFFVKENGTNENEIDYIKGRVTFSVQAPESVPLPSPWALLMTTVSMTPDDSGIPIVFTVLQMQITVQAGGNTLTDAFFSNPISELDLLDSNGNTTDVYKVGTDFTIAGTTITALTFTFIANQVYVAKT